MSDIDLLDLIDACLCTTIRKTSRSISRLYDAFLEPANVNIKQLAILITVGGLGQDQNTEENQTVTINDIAQRLKIENSTLSRNLRKLENQNLIKISPSPTSKKEKHVELTEDGLNKIQNAYKYWNEVQNITREKIGASKFNALIEAMNNLTDALSTLN